MTGIMAGNMLDLAEWLETILPTVAWVYLCRGMPRGKKAWLAAGADFAGMLCLMLLIRIPILSYGFHLTQGKGISGIPIPTFMMLLTSAAGYGYLRLRSKMQKRTVWLLFSAMFACGCCLTTIGGQLSYLARLRFGAGLPEGAIRCVVQLLFLPISVYLQKQDFDDYSGVPSGGVWLLLAGDLIILTMSVLEGIYNQGNRSMEIVFAVVFTGLLILMLASIHCIQAMCAEQSQLIDLQAERQRRHSEHEMLDWMDDNLDAMRCLRHDLKNQYAYMRILLQQGKYEDLQEYFSQMAENLPFLQNYVECGNSDMNTLLNLMASKAKAREIKIEFQLVVPPVLPFRVEDLCSLIGNLVDNALDECSRLRKEKYPEEPKVHLEIYPQKSYLVICCRNSTDKHSIDRRLGGLRTTKKDTSIHGYGTRIVTRLAEKYNGLAEFNLEEGAFVAKIMLDMTQEEES